MKTLPELRIEYPKANKKRKQEIIQEVKIIKAQERLRELAKTAPPETTNEAITSYVMDNLL